MSKGCEPLQGMRGQEFVYEHRQKDMRAKKDGEEPPPFLTACGKGFGASYIYNFLEPPLIETTATSFSWQAPVGELKSVCATNWKRYEALSINSFSSMLRLSQPFSLLLVEPRVRWTQCCILFVVVSGGEYGEANVVISFF